MKNVFITVELDSKTFRSEFQVDNRINEEFIADKAYSLAVLFASTQAHALYGRRPTTHEFAEFLNRVKYTYTIEQE